MSEFNPDANPSSPSMYEDTSVFRNRLRVETLHNIWLTKQLAELDLLRALMREVGELQAGEPTVADIVKAHVRTAEAVAELRK